MHDLAAPSREANDIFHRRDGGFIPVSGVHSPASVLTWRKGEERRMAVPTSRAEGP